MITIIQAQVNKIVFTLTEKVTITNPFFLLELLCDETNIKYFVVLGVDSSNDKGRYNAFLLTEKSSPNPLLSEIELKQRGFYHYIVYQQATDTLTPTGDILEVGKAFVKYTTPSDNYYNGRTEFTNIDR